MGIEAQHLKLGAFEVHWTADQRLEILKDQRTVWASTSEQPMIRAGQGHAVFHESRGFFQVDEKPTIWTEVCEATGYETSDEQIRFEGNLGSEHETWQLLLRAVDSNRIEMTVSVSDGNRLRWGMSATPNERIFGFGQQLTHLNIKGRRIPVLSQEPGIGRGVQPLTWIMNTFFKAGGEWHNTNAPAAWFLSSTCVGFGHNNTEYSVFDFKDPSVTTCTLYGSELKAFLVVGDTPQACLEAYTLICGRMPMLPDWVHKGAILGMQGGTDKVRKMLSDLKSHNAEIAAFWLQDWVGARTTSIGKQLWWNWELDTDRYPDWSGLRADLESQDISVMSYINPFLVNAEEKGNVRRNLYLEAKEKGYLIQNLQGEEYAIMNTSFSAALVDLSNPAAYEWLKAVIRDELIAVGARGWMADFGEALPFDIRLHSGEDPELWHNRYPMEWMRLNREAIREAEREGDIVFFNRCGFTHSPQYSTLFWMGDQLTHWRKEDGIYSALVGLLSSGLSGISLNHGDIGGYTATTAPNFPVLIPGIAFARSKELLLRWIEFFAFTAIFRTHEGNQPTRHVQIDHDSETLAHFARFSRVFSALAPYRKQLFHEAAAQGLPVVRSLWFVFPDDAETLDIDDQFCLGNSMLVAPILTPKTVQRRVYLPKGTWVDFWDFTEHDSNGEWQVFDAPIGRPIVWVQKSARDIIPRLD
ncbi:MAG: alpha-glucosidase [Myxococcota bacterium]